MHGWQCLTLSRNFLSFFDVLFSALKSIFQFRQCNSTDSPSTEFCRQHCIVGRCFLTWNAGRCFLTRKKEHQRNLKNCAKGSNIANHAWKNDHSIDFNNACVIDKGNYRVRKTLESWHTAKTVNADNNSKPLPRQYFILL